MTNNKPHLERVAPPLQSCLEFAHMKPIQARRKIGVVFATPLSFSIAINSVHSVAPKTKPDWNVIRLIRKVFGAVIVAVAIASMTVSAAAGQQGISYSRDFLKTEQKSSQQCLSEIERSLDAASRLLDAGLPGAPEHLVQAMFLTDFSEIRLEGQTDRISQLKSSFGYVRADEQRKLFATYADIRQQLQTAELRAAVLCKQCNTASNGMTILQIFQGRQGEYRNLIRAGLSDVKTVLENCNRQLLQANAPRKPEPTIHDNDKTATDLVRVQREQAELQSEFAKLRRIQQETAQPASKSANDPTATALKELETKTVELDQTVNHLRTEQSNLVSGLSSRLEQAFRTNMNAIASVQSVGPTSGSTAQDVVRAPTTTSRATERAAQIAPVTVVLPKSEAAPLSAVAAPTNTHQANANETPDGNVARTNSARAAAVTISQDAINGEHEVELTDPAPTTGTVTVETVIAKPRQLNRALLVVIIAGVLVLITAVALGFAYINRCQSEFEMFLTRSSSGRDESITIPLDPAEQCVVLNGEKPTLETRGAEDNQPCIVVRAFGGVVLRPGNVQPVSLNGELLSAPKRLHAGDVIQIGVGERSHTFTFQGGNFVSQDAQTNSLESATSTIN